MKVRWTPQSPKFLAFKDRLIVDTYRGQMRVRSWPRKRGTSKSASVRNQVQWFKEANDVAKKLEPTQQSLAIAMTLGTGLYPRDLLLMQMSGGIYDIFDEDGVHYQTRQRFRETKMFQGVILELIAPVVLPAGVSTVIPWPLPVLDTAGFWDVANPTRITIPPGFNVVEFSAGWRAVAGATDIAPVPFILLNGVTVSVLQTRATMQAGGTIVTGPRKVLAGQIAEFFVFTNRLVSAIGAPVTFFMLNVLDAD